MAGFSDAPFRSVCLEWGAEFCYTEMVSAEALVRGSAKTNLLLPRAENEGAYGIQLFGSEPATLARAAALLEPWHPSVIDLNAGCPVPKIVKSGAGSALMRNPERIRAIVRSMREATDLPITVKFRIGWDASSANYLEFAQAAAEGGAAALCLHARTKAQGYSGKADWDCLRRLKEASPVPVYGSGDLFGPESAAAMMSSTGCDAVMYARGAIGDPFVFAQAKDVLEGRPPRSVSLGERADTARRHLSRAAAAYGERLACVEFRKHFCAYTKGLPGGAEMRKEAVMASSLGEYDILFKRMESWLS